VRVSINPDDNHKARTSLVCIENTSNRGGGSCYDFDEIKKIRKVCDQTGLRFHLDGARLFNALVEKNETPQQYGEVFDSISVCLSKSLGCPVGSLLLGKKDFIKKARRVRKVFGGGMRQAGFLAAAGIYALQNNIERLKEDHTRAKQIGCALQKKSFVKMVLPVETNIIIMEVDNSTTAPAFVAKMKENDIIPYAITPNRVRFVVHLDISDRMIEKTIETIGQL
jgi:threonine aldolase